MGGRKHLQRLEVYDKVMDTSSNICKPFDQLASLYIS